jgi:hypothetical protein
MGRIRKNGGGGSIDPQREASDLTSESIKERREGEDERGERV